MKGRNGDKASKDWDIWKPRQQTPDILPRTTKRAKVLVCLKYGQQL